MTDVTSPLLDQPQKPWRQRTFSDLTPNGIRSSILNFCSSTLGAGLLSLPYAMSACGVANGCFLLLLIGASYYLFYTSFVEASQKIGRFTYVGIMEECFGSKGKRTMELVILFDTLGSLAIMNTLLCKFGLYSLEELDIATITDTQGRALYLLVLVLFVQLPLVLPRKIQSLRYASSVSIVCVLYMSMVVIGQSPAYISQNDAPVQYSLWELQSLDAVGIIFFAFSNPLVIPMIYDELEQRSPRRMKKVLRRSFLMLGLLYLLVGVLGYLSYSNNMKDIITQREGLSQGIDYPMLLGRSVYLLTITMQIPFCLYPARLALEQMVAGTDFQPSAVRYYASTALLLFVPMVMAILVPEVIFYFKIMGSVSSVLLGIVFPRKSYAVLAYRFVATDTVKKSGLTILAVLLCVIACLCTGTVFFPAAEVTN